MARVAGGPRERPVGQTRDAGWQIGVTRSVPVGVEALWQLLVSPEGMDVWLGTGARPALEAAATYTCQDGTVGEVRSYRELDRMRLTWRPPDWDHDSTVQVAVVAAGERTSLRFHQERMASAAERTAMRERWQRVGERLERLALRTGPAGAAGSAPGPPAA